MSIKKRELLPKLRELIRATVDLSGDIAILEMADSEDVALRVRRKLLDIQNIHVKELRNDIAEIRFHNKQKKLNKKPAGGIGSTDSKNE